MTLTFLYDGHCRLCVNGAALMGRLARRGAVELVDFQAAGALTPFPQVDHATCMAAAQLVSDDGRAWSGLEAIVRALDTRPLWRALTWIYFVPGIRTLADVLYARVADNRYRILGRTECPDGACALHQRAPRGRVS
jgi:predicted DCC family thiol-disulfide oxidoreductase YuxK